MGLAGAVGGVLLGLAVQYVLPQLMQDFIPVTIPFAISWASLAEAMVTGFGISRSFDSFRGDFDVVAFQFDAHTPTAEAGACNHGGSVPEKWVEN